MGFATVATVATVVNVVVGSEVKIYCGAGGLDRFRQQPPPKSSTMVIG